MFCSIAGTPPQTAISSGNSWIDSFDQPLSFTNLSPSYRQYEFGSINQSIHWQHADHWMTDINGYDQDGPGPWNNGGVAMRPDRSFMFEQRTWGPNHWGIPAVTEPMIVVETDFAAGVIDYGGNAWGEIVVTNGSQMTESRPASAGIYAYDHFNSSYTVGCRLHAAGAAYTCAGFNNVLGTYGRQWEISDFQNEASAGLGQCGSRFVGADLQNYCGPVEGQRVCVGSNPDTACRDRFRLELSRTRLAIYVNGVLHGEWSLAGKPLAAGFIEQPVFVYFGGTIYKPDWATTRLHWDRAVVNP